MPKVSIITINYNNYEGLKKTMESVFSQSFIEYEYLVIDGGSEDGSKELIEKQTHKLSYWISEKDRGIYHAMNKGIAKANGEYLLFLNSGDYFFSEVSLVQLLKDMNGEDIIYGNLVVKKEDGSEWLLNYPSELSFGFFYRSSLPHQASLIKSQLFNKYGSYNEDLKVASDWEFFIKAICFYNVSYKHVNETISVFCMGGISTNSAFTESILNERQLILDNQFGSFLKEHAEYLEIKPELNNYRNSRAHQFVERIIKSPFYKKFKK